MHPWINADDGAGTVAKSTGLLAGELVVAPVVGLSLFFIGLCMGVVEWRSAVYQGETSAACINLTGKRPEEGGRAILMPALVETYGVVALLAAILLILWVTAPELTLTNPLMSAPEMTLTNPVISAP